MTHALICRILVALTFTVFAADAGHSQGAGTEDVPPAQTPSAVQPLATPISPLYRFSGVRDAETTGRAATAIMCSNPTNKRIRVRLQLFGYVGTQYANVAYLVEPKSTYTVVTRAIAFYPAQLDLNTGAISQGMGLLFSNDPRLICSAQVIDPTNTTPVFAVGLHMERVAQ